MRGSFEGSVNAPRLKLVDTDCVREVVRSDSARGRAGRQRVIVGRGSAYYLGGSARRVSRVHLRAVREQSAPAAVDSARASRKRTSLAETVDRDRAAFIKRYFDLEWPAIHRFHLMINSSIGDAVAIETILDAVARYGSRRT